MLTKSDLKEIRTIVEEVVEVKVEEKLMPVRADILSVQKNLKKVHRSLKKENRAILDFLDRQDVRLDERVTRIEEHLDLPTLQAA